LVYLFHNITNISKNFEITKFPGKILGLGGFTRKRVLILTLKKTWKIYGEHHPPLFCQNPSRGEEGYVGGTGGGVPYRG